MVNRNTAFGASIVLAFSMLSAAANAQSLITNGGFETTTAGTGQLGFNTNATGWTSANGTGWNGSQPAFNFVYAPGSADTTGAVAWDNGAVKLWGPNTGSNNGLTASPEGGNFIAGDGAYYEGAISQTVSGLTVGQQYTLSFWMAAAQQSGFDGANWSQWNVTFGSESFSTAVMNNPSHGFTGWQQVTQTFTASATSQVLSFLADGGPQGLPPFALLDGVSLDTPNTPVVTPLPAALFFVAPALAGVFGFGRRKSNKA